jgi:hypothetical protein
MCSKEESRTYDKSASKNAMWAVKFDEFVGDVDRRDAAVVCSDIPEVAHMS